MSTSILVLFDHRNPPLLGCCLEGKRIIELHGFKAVF